MARKTKKSVIDEMAKKAAAEAIEEMDSGPERETFESPEERDLSFASEDDDLTPDFEREQKDVFVDGKARAKARFKSANFRIYRDEKWLGTKRGEYNWEQLQKDYGGGQFRVVAVDADNKFLTSQSLEVEYPEDWNAKPEAHLSPPPASNSAFEILEVMKENQREAETKAQSQQGNLATVMSTMMQTISQNQQQSTQMMMQMMSESNKQFQTLVLSMQQQNQNKGPDPFLGLLTTLITQKPKDDNGFTTANVLKMIQDAEVRAETRANKTAEQIDKKANELAEMKAEAMSAGEGEAEEGGLKGLIKGFIPVLTQMVANQQAAQPTPEHIAMMQEQRRLQAGTQGIDQGFLDKLADEPGTRVRRGPVPTPREFTGNPREPVVAPSVIVVDPKPTSTTGPVIDARKKDDIFTFCAPDIGNAMMSGTPASKTANLVLEKLEKEGYSRQTIANTFTLNDFYGYADKYGLPEEAKPWLKEFHETIQEPAGPKPIRTSGESAPRPQTVRAAPANGAGGPGTVAVKRGPSARTSPGAQPRPVTKDL